MVGSVEYLFSAAAAVLLALGCFALLITYNWFRYGMMNKPLPPGTMGFPVIGETIEFLLDLTKFVTKRRSRYGQFCKSHLFGSPTIVSSDTDFAKFVLHDSNHFAPGYPQSLTEIIGEWNLMAIQDRKHYRRMKGLLNQLVGSKNIKSSLISHIDEFIRLSLENLGGKTINLQEKTREMAFHFLIRKVIGLEPGPEADSLKRDYFDVTNGLFCIPLDLPGTAYRKGLEARKRILLKLEDIVSNRRLLHSKKDDLLAAVLKGELEDDPDTPKLTDPQIYDFLLGIIFAGHENTAQTMMMAIKFLQDCPQALERLRAEQLAIASEKEAGRKLTWEDYKSMAFTQKVVVETLKSANIVPALLRQTTSEINIGGYTVPKGWKILACFPEAGCKFDPFRKIERDLYMPFGAGMRMCPGQDLAMVEICIFLHHFSVRYKWKEVGGGHNISHVPKFHPSVEDLIVKLEDYRA